MIFFTQFYIQFFSQKKRLCFCEHISVTSCKSAWERYVIRTHHLVSVVFIRKYFHSILSSNMLFYTLLYLFFSTYSILFSFVKGGERENNIAYCFHVTKITTNKKKTFITFTAVILYFFFVVPNMFWLA